MKNEFNEARNMILKVIKRYLTEQEYKAYMEDLKSQKRITNPVFVKVMNRHFDIERWRTSPVCWQDIWLYNYFRFEFKGRIGMTGLMRKYYELVYLDEDTLFYKYREAISKSTPSLPKGVIFIPNEEQPNTANHLYSPLLEPKNPEGKR